ncbi:MAG TPA: prolyl oligopeptidase family serine peptidase [Streptosporangiaceae bacterium]|nr:prolyl oligopeptidase family serine peptidase [Streptosporangiaceae bacterium]
MTDGGTDPDITSTSADDTVAPTAATKPEIPYGEWPSPISATDVARSGLRLSFPAVIGGDVWWQEVRPDEGGRATVIRRAAGGEQTELLPAPWNARSRVHEYGGMSYLPVPGRAIAFANYADQRLYLTGSETAAGQGRPRPLTPDPAAVPAASGTGTLAPGALRYADFVLSPDQNEIWCVRERHDGGQVSRAIVAVPLDGSAADQPGAIRTLVTGSDFFAFPSPSPDGRQLAWISWNHPHMPWDGTELRIAALEDGVPGRSRLLKGSLRESVLAPLWRDDGSVYVATDWTGWWNIYQLGLAGQQPRALYPADEEFAGPLWQLGGRPFALLGDGRLAVTHGQGGGRLGILDPESFELTDLDLPFADFSFSVAADGDSIVAIAGGPRQPRAVVRVDAATGQLEILREELDDLPDEAYLPVPRPVELEGPYGRVVHALVYPPTSPDAAGPVGELPPYVVWVHGGPTGNVTALLDVEKAYFTSRGIGVVDVNYGGSSGYGRSYRERLRRQWCIVDVEDAMAAARSLADAGQADEKRLAIRGGSAGGWTALAAVTTGVIGRDPVFNAATSYFGVSDLRGFVDQTHDFESRYLDGLLGPLPGFEAVYIERAPVGHVTASTAPVLLLQGLDDPIVPPAQSESIAADLAAHGIPHAYLAFEGESHGFRRTDTVITSIEAELSFYGQILGFIPPGIPVVAVTESSNNGG